MAWVKVKERTILPYEDWPSLCPASAEWASHHIRSGFGRFVIILVHNVLAIAGRVFILLVFQGPDNGQKAKAAKASRGWNQQDKDVHLAT
jgi:hypothetical protein